MDLQIMGLSPHIPICLDDYFIFKRIEQQETSLAPVDKRGFFHMQERVKVYQIIEKTPKSPPVCRRDHTVFLDKLEFEIPEITGIRR